MAGSISSSPRISFERTSLPPETKNLACPSSPVLNSAESEEPASKESSYPCKARSTMELRLRGNNSDISIGKAAAAEKSLKEMTGFDEASLREMYEKNKDVIKKEAIPLALGWAEQEYGKTLVRAVKWAVGGNLEKIVNRLA